MTTPATRSAPSEQTDGGFTHRQTVMILIGLMMGMFLAAWTRPWSRPRSGRSPTT
jgi:hypothetical protein